MYYFVLNVRSFCTILNWHLFKDLPTTLYNVHFTAIIISYILIRLELKVLRIILDMGWKIYYILHFESNIKLHTTGIP